MKQAEKFDAVRKEAMAKFVMVPDEGYQVAVGTYAVPTEHGWAKITVQAVKDTDYDPAFEAEEYQEELRLRAETAQARQAKKDKEAKDREAKAKAKEVPQK